MRALGRAGRYLLLMLICTCMTAVSASAAGTDQETILGGIYLDHISLTGKTEGEARGLAERYAAELAEKKITLVAVEDHMVTITPADLGFVWSNPEVIAETVSLGKKGNVVQRYKAMKDLENNNKVFPLEFSLDTAMIADVITEQCNAYNIPAINAAMSRENGEFRVTEGQAGQIIDTQASIDLIYDYLQKEWKKEECTIPLKIIVQEPKGSVEELSQLTDVLGTFTTSFSTSNQSRSANVINGCRLMNGTTLYPGEEFTSYDMVSPFSADNGYYMAGSYLNGQVVDSLGGGICQVTTTLYNTVLYAELEVTERHNHSMTVAYVDASADAAIAESSGKDFRFVNNKKYPVYIEGITTEDKNITFTIYGVEERPANRTVEYISETLSTQIPENEVIYADASQPIGYYSVQSQHIGKKAQLWKVVKEDGVEVSREKVNSSSYMPSPRSATFGTATQDPVALEQVLTAITTNNIDHVKNIVAMFQPPASPAEAPVPPPVPDPGAAGE